MAHQSIARVENLHRTGPNAHVTVARYEVHTRPQAFIWVVTVAVMGSWLIVWCLQGVGLTLLAHSLVCLVYLCMGEGEPMLVNVTLIVHVANGYQRCKHGLAKSNSGTFHRACTF